MGLAYSRTQPEWRDGEAGGTPADAADMENWESGLLGTNNDLVVLFWDGAKYRTKRGEPTAISDTSKVRLFVGPTDPAGLPGVVLADNDLWDQVT
jgi:hypothetical protein